MEAKKRSKLRVIPAKSLKNIDFPECSKFCAVVNYLGVGECESVCPLKFDKVVAPSKGANNAKNED